VVQEPIQTGNGLDHANPMSHHQNGVKRPGLEVEDVCTVYILHSPPRHDRCRMGADVKGGYRHSPFLENQAVKSGSGSCIQDMARAKIDGRCFDFVEFGGITKEVASSYGIVHAIISMNNQLGIEIAVEIGTHSQSHGLNCIGIHIGFSLNR
jgi:hypothetical protein